MPILDAMEKKYSLPRKMAAWAVHIFTSLGIIAGFLSILAISSGHFREAMLWLAVGQFIDGFDGTLARWVKVEEVLPRVSGKMIDTVIDFANYALIPAYFIFHSGLIAEPWNGVATALILVVSALYYGKEGMISEDYYFVGFPVMWNLVAFYLFFVVDLSSTANLALVILLAIFHFVPLKFAYPSRTKRLRWLTLSMATVWLVIAAWIIYIHPASNFLLNGIALITLAYFGILALVDTYFLRNANS